MTILDVKHLKKTYTGRFGSDRVQALRDVTFSVDSGEYVAIMGESGSGKTTLLNILSAMDKPTGGTVTLDGRELSTLKENELALFRRENLGFVFQEFNLLDTFSLRDNIYLPMILGGKELSLIRRRAEELALSIGISDVLDRFPYEVSGGQKQRAAVVRALITGPKLILADEPTGALDSSSTAALLRVFSQINRGGQTVLMVTHSVDAASHAGRVLFIRDGVIFHQLYRGDSDNETMYRRISDTLTMLRSGGVGR